MHIIHLLIDLEKKNSFLSVRYDACISINVSYTTMYVCIMDLLF